MHTIGFPSDISSISKICKKYHLILIEDAAESLGSFQNKMHTGTFGNSSILSFNGNKIFNKLARVNAARIHISNQEYDKALKLIENYSSSSTNAYIHELTGDILVKKDKIELALAQYELASDKYSDEASKSIISMKIANLGI